MKSLTIFLLCLVISAAVSKAVKDSECGVVCAIYCQYGNVPDAKGCPTCMCKKSPCEDGQIPLKGYFCGRGINRRECPSTHYCMIAPSDAYAVCCPRS